jgi:surface antigen
MKAFLLALCLLASPAFAAEFEGLLKGSPAELFDEADLRLFQDTAYKSLDQGTEKQPLAWQNTQNGHRGDMTVLKRFESKGRNCAQLRVRNEAQGRKSEMRHNLCSIDGKWRLVGDIKKTGSKPK